MWRKGAGQSQRSCDHRNRAERCKVPGFEGGGGSHEPRHVGSIQKLENLILPNSLQGERSPAHILILA